jgi:tRNA threonylcarbamoyladenosine modification (KEOPS) complex Cgi121 subunit
MIVEKLCGSAEGLFVGLAEVLNTAKKGQEELIAVTASSDEGIHAVQLMDGAMIVDEWHLLSAAQNAANAWRGNYMISRGLDVEVAVYASGQKQISKAFEQLGVTDKTHCVALVVIGDSVEVVQATLESVAAVIGEESAEPFAPDSGRLGRIVDAYRIPKEEIEVVAQSSSPKDIQSAVSKCVVSRVSLVALDS